VSPELWRLDHPTHLISCLCACCSGAAAVCGTKCLALLGVVAQRGIKVLLLGRQAGTLLLGTALSCMVLLLVFSIYT
jgi:hypothetical protein